MKMKTSMIEFLLLVIIVHLLIITLRLSSIFDVLEKLVK